MIKYLKHKQIDKQKWDNCITESVNGLIYGYSWFLDIVSPGWDALVLDDYNAVMPLPWRKKWGIKYLFQPPFTQQLGVFSRQNLDEEEIQSFFDAMALYYKFIDYKINYHYNNIINGGFETKENTNFLLHLNHDYKNMYNQFSDSTKKNIRRSERQDININYDLSFEEFSTFFEKTLLRKVENLSHEDILILKKLLNRASEFTCLKKYVVRSRLNGEILSAACFVFHKNRIIFYSSSSEYGKAKKSMFYLLNEFIKEHSSSNYTIDFSGSNIKNIGYFFEGFGSFNQSYLSIHYNRLPWVIKILKK